MNEGSMNNPQQNPEGPEQAQEPELQEQIPEQPQEPEVQEQAGKDITRDLLQAALVDAETPEQEAKIQTAINTMENFFRINDADAMHGFERVTDFISRSDKNVGWKDVLQHYLQILPPEKLERLQRIRENDPERYDGYSKELMEGFMVNAALPKDEQENATKKLFEDLEKKYKMVWGQEDVQEEIQGIATIIHALKEKIGDKEVTPEEAKEVQKEISGKKEAVNELLKKTGTIGGIMIGLAIGGILLAFLFELALLETVTKKVR